MIGDYKQCPSCGKTDNLYRGVKIPGWQEVRVRADGQYESNHKPEADHSGTHPIYYEDDGDFGCGCGWEGGKSELVQIGWDGEPLQPVHPAQGTLT